MTRTAGRMFVGAPVGPTWSIGVKATTAVAGLDSGPEAASAQLSVQMISTILIA